MPPSSSMASQGGKENGASRFPQQGHCSSGGSRFSRGPGGRDSGSGCSGLVRVLRGEAEQSIQVSDGVPSVSFGSLGLAGAFRRSPGLVVAASGRRQCLHARPYRERGSRSARQCSRTASSIERALAALAPAASMDGSASAAPKLDTRAKAGPAQPPPRTDGLQPRALQSVAPAVYPGLDQSVVAAALASGVEPHVLGEMSRLVDSRPLQRLRAEPSQNTAGRRPTPLKEPEAVDPVAAPAATSTSLQPARSLEPAEALAQAMVRCLDSLRSGSCKQSVLDRALDASGGGSLDGSLNSGRRNAAARKALRDSLTSAPQEISKMIEALMAEDLNASTPGAGSPVLSSTRAWLEHRSRIQAFPSMVHLTWAIAGALDCLRASKPEQARARLNIALLQADQCSIDRGSWLLAQELSLELGPPMSSFRKHDSVSAAGDPAYSRLLDPRWAEIALSRLREEAEFTDRRQKLSHRTTTTNKEQDETPADPGERPPRRPPRKPPKADA